MLIIDRLSKTLGPRRVLRRASLRYEGPGTLWICGPNGMGKSTLLKCIAGVWRPDEGDVLVFGQSTIREPRALRHIGYVPDTFTPFPDLTVNETFALVAALKRAPLPAREVLERFGVAGFAHQSVARLSAGQTRRAALVAGLIGDPWLLVLDEPTTGLDVDGVALLAELLRGRRAAGLATLLVSHDTPFVSSIEPEAYEIVDGGLSRA